MHIALVHVSVAFCFFRSEQAMSFGPGNKAATAAKPPEWQAVTSSGGSKKGTASSRKSSSKKSAAQAKPKARIEQLDDVDKAKIGNLIYQVVQLGKERKKEAAQHEQGQQRSRAKPEVFAYLTERKRYQAMIDQYKAQNEEIIRHTVGVKSKFSHSLTMLRAYQQRLKSLQAAKDNESASLKRHAELEVHFQSCVFLNRVIRRRRSCNCARR